MTHNWNTLTPCPKATNEFGQPLLEDYGQDNLFPIYVDMHGAPETATDDRVDLIVKSLMDEGASYTSTAPKRTGAQIVALLDDAQPAMIAVTDTLEPDFVEDGMAWWIGVEATIGCPVGMEGNLGSVVAQGGWHARVGNYPATCGVVVMPHSDADLPRSPLGRHHEQYALWSLARSTVLA